MGMNPRFLHTVIAVSRHGSLNAAARSLGLSHSAVSLQIKALEEDLQFQILDRSRRPPTLTGEGAALVEHARRMEEIAADIRALADGNRLQGRVTIGVVPSTISHLAAPALAEMFAAHPDLRIEMMSDLSQRLLDLVRDGTVDAALVTDPGGAAEELDLAQICAEPFRLLASEAVAEGGADGGAEGLLCARPFVWFDRRSSLSQQVEAYLRGRGLRVEAAMEVDAFEAVEALVAHGLGVSILPRRALAPEAAGVLALPLPEGLPDRRVVLASRHGSPRQVFASRFAEVLRGVLRRGAEPSK